MASVCPSTWVNFRNETNGGAKPFLYKGLLPVDENCPNYAKVINSISKIPRATTDISQENRIRLYTGEDRRDDLLVELCRNLPYDLTPDTLIRNVREFSGSDTFSLIINNFERISDELSADLGRFIQSFFGAEGMPLGGTEQVVFCGNYNSTAFGIHQGYEDAFLCHFGPGQKDFYCVDAFSYCSLTRSPEPVFCNSDTFNDVLKIADKYVLEPGDVLFLPAGIYHVGRQESFSISIALPLYTYPHSRFLSHAVLPALSSADLPFDEEGRSELVSFSSDMDLVRSYSGYANRTVRSWAESKISNYISSYWHTLKSNGGWELQSYSEVISKESSASSERFEELKLGSLVTLHPPFLISIKRSGSDSDATPEVYYSSNCLKTRVDIELAETISQKLNNDQHFVIKTNEELKFIEELSQLGKIEVKCYNAEASI
ncbi:JmjC domain-containing protein [Marinobacter adhaerens]|uniref:JmjC domain-containing protein n=1 Tax=Marinobacter adhaerens TaxID=1033846 RepID=UPI003BA89236